MASLKERLDAAGYDTSNFDEAATIRKLDAAGYDVSGMSAPTAPKRASGGIAEAVMQASDPQNMLNVASPSNIGKMGGVAAANAPGIAGLFINSIPGIGNPAAIMPSAQNVVQNPQQAGNAASRVIATQGDADMSPQEKKLSRMGQAAGMVVELAAPGGASREAALEAKAANAEAMASMQELTPGVKTVQKTVQEAPRMLPEPMPRAPEIDRVAGEAAEKFNKSLEHLTEKAKVKYKLAQKVLGVDIPQEGLKVRNAGEIQAAFDEVMAAKKPVVNSLGKDLWTGIEKTETTNAMSKRERLQQLWQLDKELSQNINYNDPASQQGLFGLQKQIRAEIAELPGGKKLADVRKEYSEMRALQDELGSALQDPAKQKIIMQKIAKGEIKGTVTEANAARAAAIDKLEKMTGQDVLSDVRGEYKQKELYDSAALRKQAADKIFGNEQRKAAYEAAIENKNYESALAKLRKEEEISQLRDAKLLKRMAAENPEGLRKKKMMDALKFLATKTGAGIIGGTAATVGYHLLK